MCVLHGVGVMRASREEQKASRRRHLSVTQGSCERDMPGEWHLPGAGGHQFCQAEPRLATIMAWAEKIRAARSVSIVARRFTKN